MYRAASYLRYNKYLFRFSFRRFLFLYCSIVQLFNHCSAESEEVIQVDTFLANVNLSEQKVFFVRNNLEVSRQWKLVKDCIETFLSKEDGNYKDEKTKTKTKQSKAKQKKTRPTKHNRTNSQTRKTVSVL